jgi:hypothetical protein
VADGKWHAYEVHINPAAGVFETWIDGRRGLKTRRHNLGDVTLDHILVGSNTCCVAKQPDMYTDYDDFAVSTSGYIGPIGSAPQPPPR